MKTTFKRTLAFVLSAFIVMTMFVPDMASAKTFKDVSKSHWAYSYIDEMSNKGLIDGYKDGTFKPAADIKFLEALKLTAMLIDIDDNALSAATKTYTPIMVKYKVPEWARPYVIKNFAKGVLGEEVLKKAYQSKMWQPKGGKLGRLNVAVFFAKALDLKSTKPVISLPYKDAKKIATENYKYLDALIDAGILDAKGMGNGNFEPNTTIRRDAVAKMLAVSLNYKGSSSAVTPVNPTPVTPTPVAPTPTVPSSNIVVTGKVSSVASLGTNTYLVVDTSTGPQAFIVNDTTVVTIDGTASTYKALTQGQEVTLQAAQTQSGTVATQIQAKSSEVSIEGKVISVYQNRNEIRLQYTKDNKTAEDTFSVTNNTEIKVNGSKAAFRDITEGASFTAKIVNGTLKSIDVKGFGDRYTGYIKSLDNSRITITSADGRDYTYYLASERDLNVYDNRRNASYNRNIRLYDLQYMIRSNSVAVQLKTDTRSSSQYETVYEIDIIDGLQNEYIVKNIRFANSYGYDEGEIELYQPSSYSQYGDALKYTFDRYTKVSGVNSLRSINMNDRVIISADRSYLTSISVIGRSSSYPGNNPSYGNLEGYLVGIDTQRYIISIRARDSYTTTYIYYKPEDYNSYVKDLQKNTYYYFNVDGRNVLMSKPTTYGYNNPSRLSSGTYRVAKDRNNNIMLTDQYGQNYYSIPYDSNTFYYIKSYGSQNESACTYDEFMRSLREGDSVIVRIVGNTIELHQYY